jgi:hypothetical protein
MAIPTDSSGVATLRLTDKDDEIDVHNATNPVVKYDESIRIVANHVLCQAPKSGYSWLATISFPTRQIIQQGVVTRNLCGRASADPKPGDLTIFVRPLNWLEKMKQ